ncbi:MAG: hypothetical protein JNG90_12680, partial [Planctomycetaceae bacterium]|nr:hypothetical protein [Planctomycetaceae bacterium]
MELRGIVLAGWAVWGGLGTQAPAAEPRLFELPAFDQVELSDKKVIKVCPIEFQGGRRPENPRPGDKLIVRLLDKPTEEYSVAWRDIVEIKSFDRLILDEAEQLVAAGKLAEAFAYFDYLERNRPDQPDLKAATEKYLFADARDCQRRKKYAEALAVLDELHQRNPDFPGLDRAWGAATDKVLEPLVAAGDFVGARNRLHQLRKRFPQEPSGLKWQQLFESQAGELIAQARTEAAEGRLQLARQHVFAALERWPADEQARGLAQELFRRSPALNVAVTQPLRPSSRDPLTDWSARRTERLRARSLLELTGYGEEGGVYASPFGEFSIGELGLELNFRLKPELRQTDGRPYTGYDLSQYILQRLRDDPDSLLGEFVERVTVRGVYDVDLSLRRAHVRPEVLLDHPPLVRDPATGKWDLPAIAPFEIAEQTPQIVRFVANEKVRGPGAAGPGEIVEQTFAKGMSALGALDRGEVLLVDRLNPWDVATAATISGVVVQPYAAPTVHVLIPNLQHPLLAKRLFRRALVYGLNREAILRVQLLRGGQLADTRVTSGPFPWGYAYNEQVEVRPYEPRMAMTLAEIAAKELALEQQGTAQESPTATAPAEPRAAGGDDAGTQPAEVASRLASAPPLRLAIPPTEVARLAARAIQKKLKLLKIWVDVKELGDEPLAEAVKTYDLVYVELQPESPITDARRLFGITGLASGSSP